MANFAWLDRARSVFCGRVPSQCLVAWAVLWGVAAQAQSPATVPVPPNTSASASASAPALRALHAQLQAQLRESPFGEPLVLVSVQADKRLQGDVYAELTLPLARLQPVLDDAVALCGVMFLHLNVHGCEVGANAGAPTLTLTAGPKQASMPGARYSMTYTMEREATAPDYVRVVLRAASGPLSTSDYHMVIEAVALDGARSWVHLGYAYRISNLAQWAMSAYLATAGRSKIGFTVTGKDAAGQPQYVQGERGSLERNAMRNYLALVAYASAGAGISPALTEQRLRAWFALTERHSAQLHELSLDEYLAEKHRDLAQTPMQ